MIHSDEIVLRMEWLFDPYPIQVRQLVPGLLEAVEEYGAFSFAEDRRFCVVGMLAPSKKNTVIVGESITKLDLWWWLWGDMHNEFKGQYCLQLKGKFSLWRLLLFLPDWPQMLLSDFAHILSHLTLHHLTWTAVASDPDYSAGGEPGKLSEFVWAPPDSKRVYIVYDKPLRSGVVGYSLEIAQAHLINLLKGVHPLKKLNRVLEKLRQEDWERRRNYNPPSPYQLLPPYPYQ